MSELACLPYSVGHGHEGVCLQVQIGPYRVLLDCGLAEGVGIPPDPAGGGQPVDLVLCSHAHPDHVSGLLEFHQTYPKVPIFASEVTAQLLPLNWQDSKPVPADLCHALPWRTPIEVAKGLTLQLWPAGHLPGAACVLLSYVAPERTYTAFYTGDFFLSNSRLVEGLPLEEVRGLKPDVLILEGSYGTARYPHRRQQENRLADNVFHLLQEGRSVLLPTPTLGIGQELAMLLRSHHQFTGQDLTVWVDPVVAAGCDMYLELMPYFPSSVQNFARHQPLFWDERILPRVRRIPAEGLPELDAPSIVIGHRTSDLSSHCSNSPYPWTILFPESFATSIATVALQTHSNDANPTLDWLQLLAPEMESGRVQIATYLLTTHSDATGTTQLIHNLRPQHVVFVHGDSSNLSDLACLEDLQNRYQLHLPSAGNSVDLPIGETFVQPAAPDIVYDGEVTETGDGITVLLPETLTADPRWMRFGDTGVLQARWQGDELVLHGVSQHELLSDANAAVNTPYQECCQRCVHMRGQRCWNTASPLYRFRVTPEGYCPAFEAQSNMRSQPNSDSSEETA
ncbi:MBL fold metallo-hydrolase [Pseudanabaena sp. FACHB-2040]|uniref:MBL fold metallo-hydrolase n=1 Tax=Pseudanabaena sp. FACHB-2040 TaxID=2692859 RepID=UPI0032205DAD